MTYVNEMHDQTCHQNRTNSHVTENSNPEIMMHVSSIPLKPLNPHSKKKMTNTKNSQETTN